MPSLFETVAIEPGAFHSASDLRAAVASFGFSVGLLVAELPGSWFRQTAEALNVLREVERASALRFLRRLQQDALVSVGFPYQSNKPWLENVKEAIRTNYVDAAVVDQNHESSFPDLLSFIDAGRPSPSRSFAMDFVGYESVCRRMIEARPRVILVDPYFDVSDEGYARFVSALVNWRLPHGDCYLDVIARASICFPRTERPGAEFERRAKAMLDRTVLPGVRGRTIEIVVTLIDDEYAGRRMHDRFLFNDKGGITVGSGFRLARDAPITIAGVLSKDDVSSLFSLYAEGRHGNVVRHRVVWSGRQPERRSS